MRKALEKTAVAAVSLAFALTPCWLYIGAKFLLAPEGFWQNFLILGISAYFLGFLQFAMILIWLIFVIAAILN